MATITVTHLADDRFRIEVRGHQLLVDQPHREGGEEAGPTPTELFVTSLAACVGHYAAQFLRRHEQPYEGVRVDCDWRMLAAESPRVGRIQLDVTPPEPVPAELRGPLQEAIEHCTVHSSLKHPPKVTITLAVTAAPARAGHPSG
jgi:uncharacterized OsmC-like protein